MILFFFWFKFRRFLGLDADSAPPPEEVAAIWKTEKIIKIYFFNEVEGKHGP